MIARPTRAALVSSTRRTCVPPLPSVATTIGSCRHGFLLGSFDANDGKRELGEGVQVTASMWGDRASGPVMLMIKGEAGATVIPGFTSATETMCVLASGSCRIGATSYNFGDLRIQAADLHQEEVTAGPEGVELMLLIADRRALPKVAAADASWGAGLDVLVAELGSDLDARPPRSNPATLRSMSRSRRNPLVDSGRGRAARCQQQGLTADGWCWPAAWPRRLA